MIKPIRGRSIIQYLRMNWQPEIRNGLKIRSLRPSQPVSTGFLYQRPNSFGCYRLPAACRPRDRHGAFGKVFLRLAGCVLLLGLLLGCESLAAPPAQSILSVGMILGSGGLGDRSFNDSAYAGLQAAQRQFGARFHVVDYSTDQANVEELERLIRQEYDLIIGIGFENAGYIETLAQAHPDQKFAVVDTVATGDNVASIVFREQEGDFLMGVLAAMLSQTGQVGFIGGMDIPTIHRIEQGFKQGVAYQNSQVEIISDMAGTFADPEIGQAMAVAQYEAGVDVIYNAAGRTGLGIIEAAKETGKLTIGTSGDQRYLAPGQVVGNRPKRVDTAVLTLIREVENDQFTPGVRSLGLAEEGLSLGPFDELLVSPAMSARLEQLQQQIIAGDITIAAGG